MTPPAPEISVVMPCFNAAETLEAAIESIRNQSFREWELLIVDDGSRDATPGLAEAAAAMDSRLRLVRQ
ncbi:MAG TPA: glycosyltransferase, partial [Candidatus Hydrogenedentes bacterium]|nr:glycosyltransferase [Candidatus Hydrogenedentota bacterium]